MISVVDLRGQVQQDVAVDQPANMEMLIIRSVFQFQEHRARRVVRKIHQQRLFLMMDEQLVLPLVTGIVVKQVVRGQAKHW